MKRTIAKVSESEKRYNILAIVSFVCAFLFPLIGLIISIIALVTIKDDEKGKGFAIAGLTISIFFILIIIAIIIAFTALALGTLDITKINAEINHVMNDCDDGTCNITYNGSANIKILSNNASNLRSNINVTPT
jgi:uncharacterized membrane protein